jgi:outer membrane immunogenic protein
MKLTKIFAAALLASTAAGSAFAADLPSRKVAPVYVAPAPIFTWSGLYVGVNAGYAWSNSNRTTLYATDTGPFGFVFAQATGVLPYTLGGNGKGGFIGGGQIGYNWQFGSMVAGLEADIQGVSTKGNISYAGFSPIAQPTYSNFHRSASYLGTVRARLGFTVMPTFLLYATGGLAYGGTNLSFAAYGPTWGPALAVAGSANKTAVGWTAGLGAEYALSPNWSVKAEWLYYDLGSLQTGTAVYAYGANLTTLQARVRTNGNIVRAGVNYRFNWGAAPVVARY